MPHLHSLAQPRVKYTIAIFIFIAGYFDVLHMCCEHTLSAPRRQQQNRHSKTDLLQGTLDLLILRVVKLGPIHGYAIAQRIQEVSKDVLRVQQGSLYPALHRLEKRGWLKADWRETETGREAKFYSLTKQGLRQLEEETSEWERLSAAAALILRTTE